MAWDRGYYYRTERVNGRVVRRYVGAGEVALLIAEYDALEREQRQADRKAKRELEAEYEALDAEVDSFGNVAQLAAQIVLESAGYHQHHRGQWRRRRGNANPAE